MSQKPYLNGGCGKRILPSNPEPSDWLVDPAIYHYPLWVNADINPNPGVDTIVDLFEYPWPFEGCSFDGAYFSHLLEHCPHDAKVKPDHPDAERFLKIQDSWYCFFSELTRVLTPGAIAHIVAPYAFSSGAMTDPTHRRYLTEHVWTHSLAKADVNPSFAYSTGDCNLEMVEPAKMWITQMYYHLLPDASQPYIQQGGHNWSDRIVYALQTQINVCYAMYVKLKAVK